MKRKNGLVLGLFLSVVTLTPRAATAPIGQTESAIQQPKAENKSAPRVDRYGDPLPQGAIARLGTLRFRIDTNYIEHLAFAPDGKSLATATYRGLTLWDAASGKQTKSINPSDTLFIRLAYSPDGKRLMAYASHPSQPIPKNTVVQIWEVAGGCKITETELESVCWLGWSAKGQPQAACLGKGEIVYHELATGRKLHLSSKDLFGAGIGVRSVGLCRCVVGENVLAASGAYGSIHLWDLANGKERLTVKAGEFVQSLALSPDGRLLACVARDADNKYPVQLWDASNGKLVRTFEAGLEVLFAPDGKTLATTFGTEIRFWDVDSGRQRSRIRTETDGFGKAAAFAPDSKTFATTGQENGSIQLWSVADGKPKPQSQGHSGPPIQAVFSPDGKSVATCASMDGGIRLWDAASGEPLLRIHHQGWARGCAFSADGRTLYSCCLDDKLHLDDAASGRERHVLKVEDPDRPKFKPSGLGLHLSDDRTRLIAFHTDDDFGTEMLVTVWDAATHKLLSRRRRIQDAYMSALSADGRTLAAAHAGQPLGQGMPGREMGSGPMHLEEVASGTTLLTFPSLTGQTWPVAFSADGRLLLSHTDGPLKSGQRGMTLRLWEALTASELLTFTTSFGTSPAFAPDGRLLAISTAQKEILVWDLSQAAEHQRFRGFDAAVKSLDFSPDGRRLVSGLSDSTLLVWDVRPGKAAISKINGEKAAKAWNDLAAADAARAFRARWTLASAPQEALDLFKQHLHPAKAADPQRLRRLLADLESEQFAVREKAQEELEKLGDLAEPALRQILTNKPALEVRRRVQAVLERMRGPVTRSELLQSLRAVAVLEDLGTPAARRRLEELAAGASESRLTREAKAALQRLERRTKRAGSASDG